MDNAAREAAISLAVHRVCTGVHCEVDEVMLKAAITKAIDAVMARFDLMDLLKRTVPHAERVFELLNEVSKAHIESMAYLAVGERVAVDFIEHAAIVIASRSTLH